MGISSVTEATSPETVPVCGCTVHAWQGAQLGRWADKMCREAEQQRLSAGWRSRGGTLAAWLWRFSRSTDSRYLRECASHEYACMFLTPAAHMEICCDRKI